MTSFPSHKTAAATAVENALWLHRSGRLQEAENMYRQVLATSPAHFDALHLLGVLSHQSGDHQQAVKLIEKATRINKKNPTAFNHLGAAYRALGRLTEAEKSYRTALRLQPDFPEAYFNLGNTLADLKRLKEAERAYCSALKQKPDYPAAHNNLGNVLKDLGRPDEAEAACTRALELAPDFAEAYCNLAFILLDLDRVEEAECALKKALVIRPDHAETYFQLGNTLVKLKKLTEAAQIFRRNVELTPNNAEAFLNLGSALHGLRRFKGAEAAYLQAISLKPEIADTYNNLGNTLAELNRLEEAEKMYLKALVLKPDYADAYYNLGNTLSELNRLEEAEKMYFKALALMPDYSDAYYSLANALVELGRWEDAEEAFRQALVHNPKDAVVKWDLGHLKLLQGDFAEGLKLYESRFERGSSDLVATIKILEQLQGHARWNGEFPEGMSLFVVTEQGVGDNLMMMRYLPMLKNQNLKKLTVYNCHPNLLHVMQCLPGIDRIVPVSEQIPFGDFDLYCPIMSLPYLFQTRQESIPATVPYLVIPEEPQQKWQTRLAGVPEFKVGLVWAGNQNVKFDKVRSVPLSKFAPLLETSGAHFFSLQKVDELQQLKELEWKLTDWMDECEDYLDTAALVEQLDLIISVDTSVAHLAGALGKPVWLLNRFESEWRWMQNREDSPWYPSMRIFTQPVRRDWDSVIKRVCEELALLLREKGRSFL